MKKIFKKEILLQLLFIFLLSFTPLFWFREGMIMVGNDNVFPLNPLNFLRGRFSTWSEWGLGESQALIMGSLPIHFVDALPYLLGFSLETTQKIVYIFWFFLIGLSAYILASTINYQSRIFKLASVLLYQFNFFLLQGWWIGERTKFSAYIALPLVLTVFYKVYKGDLSILKGAIFNSLILFLFNAGGLLGIPLYGGFFISLGLFFLYFSILSYFQKQKTQAKRLFFLTVASFLIFLIFNAYYLLPAVERLGQEYKAGTRVVGGISGVIDWSKEISVGSNYLNLMRLQGMPDWYDNPEHPYAQYYLKNPLLIFLSFLWPLLVIFSLLLVKEKEKLKVVFFFFLVYLVGIFFAAGTHPPLDFIYIFLLKFLPGFVIFRTPYYKFAPAIFLANAFLISYTIEEIKDWLVNNFLLIRKLKIFTLIFFSGFLFLVLGYHFPYFTGDFFSWTEGISTRLKIPEYVFEFSKWVKENRVEGKILILPKNHDSWELDIYRWGYLSLFPLAKLLGSQPLLVNSETLQNDEKRLLDLVYQSLLEKNEVIFRKLALLLNIKYLLLRNDTFYDLVWAKTTKPSIYKEIINSYFNFPLEKKMGEWELYKINFSSTPRFYLLDKIDTLDIPSEELFNYFLLSDEILQFVLEADKRPSLSFLPRETVNEYYRAFCLNCRYEKKPIINFPERPILSDSPLYPFVLWKENIKLRKADTKSRIYDNIGLSLKRIAEIRGLFYKQPGFEVTFFNSYLKTLQKIEENFAQIENFADKFQIAEDLNYYLEAEREYFQSLVGEKTSNPEETKVLEKVFGMIFLLEGEIEPYLLRGEEGEGKLYILKIRSPQLGELFISSDFSPSILKNEKVDNIEGKLIIDDSFSKDFSFKVSELEENLVSLGKFEFSEGEHKVFFFLKNLPNFADKFREEKNSSGMIKENCYSSEISNFSPEKRYKFYLSYKNDFSDNFLIITGMRKKNGEKLESIYKFSRGKEERDFEEVITPDREIREIYIKLCSSYLNEDFLREKIKLRVTERSYPTLIFKPEIEKRGVIKPIVYTQESPTKYFLEVEGIDRPLILSFLERFDEGWKLRFSNSSENIKTHFKMNGYANGWLLTKNGSYRLVLEYSPQRRFYWGSFITGISLFLFLGYFIWRKK